MACPATHFALEGEGVQERHHLLVQERVASFLAMVRRAAIIATKVARRNPSDIVLHLQHVTFLSVLAGVVVTRHSSPPAGPRATQTAQSRCDAGCSPRAARLHPSPAGAPARRPQVLPFPQHITPKRPPTFALTRAVLANGRGPASSIGCRAPCPRAANHSAVPMDSSRSVSNGAISSRMRGLQTAEPLPDGKIPSAPTPLLP
jgi:hypothetical protein